MGSPARNRLIKLALFLGVVLQLVPSLALADNLQVTATIPAKASDYTVTLTSSPTGGPFGPGQDLAYTITYGTSLAYDTPVTIVASWSQAAPAGASSFQSDILSYVAGSATTAVNNTPPVVDLINRTVTWQIASLPPATTDATVSFHLRTSNTYVPTEPLLFSVTGVLEGPGVATPPSTLDQSFFYIPSPVTPAPTATPTQVTPTPQPTQIPFGLHTIDIQSITPDSMTVFVQTSLPSSITLLSGSSSTTLSPTASSQTLVTNHLLRLSGLTPQTPYYFRIVATDAAGQSITSDLFTFKTAGLLLQQPTPNLSTFTALSHDILLASPTSLQETSPLLPLPLGTSYTFRVALRNAGMVRHVQGIVRAVSSQLSRARIELTKISAGVYQGTLLAPQQSGSYKLLARIFDTQGGIIEQTIANLKVSLPLRVLDKQTNKPIPDAKVTLYSYDQTRQVFERITASVLGITNPLFAKEDGSVDVVLPAGTYEAKVSSLGYRKQTVRFTLGDKPSDGYPTIYLENQSVLSDLSTYLHDSYEYVINDLTRNYFLALSSSPRALYLTALVSLISLALLTFLSFTARTSLSLWLLPAFVLYHSKLFFQHKKSLVKLQGLVHNENSLPLEHVAVFITSDQDGRTIAHTTTDRHGRYSIVLHQSTNYWINFFKDTYHPLSLFQTFPQEKTAQLQVVLASHTVRKTLLRSIKSGIMTLLGRFFEVILILSFLFQLVMGLRLGFGLVIWFFLLSLFNLFTWVVYLHNRQTIRT